MTPPPRAGVRSVLRLAEPVACVVAILTVWEIVSRTGLVYEPSLPPPSTIASALATDIQQSSLWLSIWQTVEAWLVGMAIVVALALPFGALIGLSKVLSRASLVTLEFIRAIPAIAALPILVLMYGIGLKLTIVLIVIGALWPLLIQTMYGVQDVDPIARETARVYGLGRFRIFRLVVAPSAAPYVATGLRLSGVTGMILAVAATLLIGGKGLGAAIAEAQQTGQIPQMYDRIFMAGLLGVVVTLVLRAVERHFLRWHPSTRAAA
jgi:ABC-type nitrate/sulfonate/bicarbonate transport system permease component